MKAGAKYDAGKPDWALLPLDAVGHVVRVLSHGAVKYGKNNWRQVDGATERYIAALLRHLEAWRGGETLDPDSGLPHVAHMACNAIFLVWFECGGRRANTNSVAD